MVVYIGIDPGKNGGYALIDTEGQTVAYPWDDGEFVLSMRTLSEEFEGKLDGRAVACVEKVGAMPGQGVSSMFAFGKSAGFIEGVLAATGIPYQLVPPRVWKKTFSLGSDKHQSIDVCKKLFPGLDLRRTEKCRKESDGIAEALLICEYARRMF